MGEERSENSSCCFFEELQMSLVDASTGKFSHRQKPRAKSQLAPPLFPLGTLKIYQPKSVSRYGKVLDDKKRRNLMSYECRQEKRMIHFGLKSVYFIPSYIFSHMIVHML